ncbi:serine/threonine protein kinase, partial [Myxococcota bacterium]|nr:serine/threonine protein kinase [Myxococcota bacterium]
MQCGYGFPEAGEPTDPWIGRLINNRYRILKKLGDGGMGEVYLAQHLHLEERVALKLLRAHFADRADQVERFKREAKAARQLEHPNTIRVHDFGVESNGTLYFAMEYLQGRSLGDLLEEEKKLEPARAVQIMSQVCASLIEAHAQGIVHRDLKPDNIFLIQRHGCQEFVKVLDFGIAKVTQAQGEALESITQAGAIFGTPKYMSPEQVKGAQLDARSDVYALGVILYEAISGHLPFKAHSAMEMLTHHLATQPQSFVESDAKAQDGALVRLEAVALRALSKDPDQRQPTVEAFLENLMSAVPGVTLNTFTGMIPAQIAQPTGPRSVPQEMINAEPSKSRAGLIIFLAAVCLAGAGTAYVLNQGGGPAGLPQLLPALFLVDAAPHVDAAPAALVDA